MKNRYVLAIDALLITLAAFAAFTARFDFMFFQHRPEFVPYLRRRARHQAARVHVLRHVSALLAVHHHPGRRGRLDRRAASSLAMMALFVVLGVRPAFVEFSRVVV